VKKPVPFGKYYLLERINVGGMAEVFRAKSFGVEGFERLVAVKRILPNIAEDRDFIKMFIDEAKIAVQLNHANIAQIFDLGVVDNAYYIALEHIHGRDLRATFDRCRQLGEPMSIAQACFVVMKVCEGLDYAHNKRDQNNREIGLVHRDVSPQNVLVSFEGEVKLIDFGIAKAADKSAKTQAGILKGKFGYMSPEQVRGLPIDRRSDIFSCGIVLYELLTGERLFVGESDFSTLEKVRNVEILPPSTYNRKIPDELERIVLKALTKDPDERYSNAIDLHDELQAFVYTASEFYSRKDLAAWMKRTFAREIEEETAKLETYRQLKPPAPERTPPPQRTTGPYQAQGAPRRPTASMAVVPPPAPGTGGPPSRAPSGPPERLGRATLNMPAAPAPGRHGAPATLSAQHVAVKPPGGVAGQDDSGLAWDDDELETQIYDNADDDAAVRSRKSGPAAAIAAAAAEPDLSSLVSTAKGWQAPPPPAGELGAPITAGPAAPTLMGAPAPVLPSSTLPGFGAAPSNGANGHGLAAGSSPSPFFADASPIAPMAAPIAPTEPAFGIPGGSRESSAVMRLVEQSEPIFDSVAFGAGVAAPTGARKSKIGLIVGIAAAVLFVGAIATVWIVIGGKKGASSADETARPAAAAEGADPAGPAATGVIAAATDPKHAGDAPPPAAAQTGVLDLFVTPSNVVGWRLDGVAQTGTLPARIKDLTAGKHTIEIDAPPGFMSETKTVEIEADQMQKLEIQLAGIEVVAIFETEPAGATVTLVSGSGRIDLGPSPARHTIDPAVRYEVIFEKPGYVSVAKPVQASGKSEEVFAAVLDPARVAEVPPKTGGGKKPERGIARTDKGTRGGGDKTSGGGTIVDAGGDKGGDKGPGAGGDKPTKGDGILSLGAKPPCEIYIDGKATGLRTPQREIKLSAGRHKVTLMNNEYGIKESFTIEIKAGEVTKSVKDFTDRMTGDD
jgi:eukaryotic-like serine/threonine-protein kinase